MSKSNQLKVVWLTHLNNPYIAKKLGVDAGFESAPWMNRFAEIFKKYDAADIHIVSPNRAIRKIASFQDQNIHYHFIPYTLPPTPGWIKKILQKLTPLRRLKEKWNPYIMTEYKWMKDEIGKTIEKIDPDIIHLFGAENAFYSTSIFQFKNIYPVLINIHGFINFSSISGPSATLRKRTETDILRTFHNFGVMYDDMAAEVKKVNPDSRCFTYKIAPYQPEFYSLPEDKKEYDLIFFARITKEKGIEDLIEAMPAVQKHFNDVRLAVVGLVDENYLKKLRNKIEKLEIRNNIDLIGSKDTLDEVHQIAIKSKITVLPTHFDTIPGTILESMQMGLPCITCPVGGLPTLEDHVVLVEKENPTALAEAIINLLGDDTARLDLGKRAREYVEKRWSEDAILNTTMDIYREVVG